MAALALAAAPASAQIAVSIRAGLVDYLEGEVWIGDRRLDPQSRRFEELPLGVPLRTVHGKAEVVLGPGRILRLAPQTEIVLRDDRLEAVEIEATRGAVYLTWTDLAGGGGAVVAVRTGPARWEASHPGRYRWDVPTDGPPRLRVHDGKVKASAGGKTVSVKSKHEALLAEQVSVRDLDERRDSFDHWNARRSRIVARLSRAGHERRRGPGGFGGRGGRGGRGGGIPPAWDPGFPLSYGP